MDRRGRYRRLSAEGSTTECSTPCEGLQALLATYLQTPLACPDGCTRGETVFDPATAIPSKCRRSRRRKGLALASHTGTRNTTGRMDNILTWHGFAPGFRLRNLSPSSVASVVAALAGASLCVAQSQSIARCQDFWYVPP